MDQNPTSFSTFLSDLYKFWFSKEVTKYWFNSTAEFDELIKTKYSDILINLSIDKISHNNIQNIEDDYRLSIGLILLHDQIPRHIYRDNQNKTEINHYLDLILSFSKKTYIKYKYDLKPNDYCFVLLPLRHTNSFDNIMYVIQETKIKIKHNQHELIYKKFLKATLERYIKFNKDKENIILTNDILQTNITQTNITQINITQINDPKQICELELLNYIPTPIAEIKYDELPDYIRQTINHIKKHTYEKSGIISLSGGVDSMVLCYILKFLNINFIAIHINYNNRKECSDEVNIITQWVKFLNIKLYVRKITEINRSEMMDYNMRDLYESYTRDIRFNTYIHADDHINNNIFVGHNHDDQFENIFTNIVSESHYQNLRGMEFITNISFKQNVIKFIRPMLNISKDIIYKISRYFNIPNFKDSTPKWSQRGKIRDHVRPSIEHWDNKSINSFFKLSDTMSDLMKIADMSATIIMSQVKKDKNLPINLDELYPRSLFKLIFEKMDIRLSQKGLNSFYDKMIFIKENKLKYKNNAIEKYALDSNHLIKWKNLNDNNIILLFDFI